MNSTNSSKIYWQYILPEDWSSILHQDNYRALPRCNSWNCVFPPPPPLQMKFLLYFSRYDAAGVPKFMIIGKPDFTRWPWFVSVWIVKVLVRQILWSVGPKIHWCWQDKISCPFAFVFYKIDSKTFSCWQQSIRKTLVLGLKIFYEQILY
jgi:hypothetical protein